MKRRRTARLELKGKPGNWIALAGESRQVVAEARRLVTLVRRVREAGLKDIAYARVPRADHTLVL